jgi:hypothetical protein
MAENAHYVFHPKITEKEASKLRFDKNVLYEGTSSEMRSARCPSCGQMLISLVGKGALNAQIAYHRELHVRGAVVDRPR